MGEDEQGVNPVVNALEEIPVFCKNCLHRSVCAIQPNIQGMERAVATYNVAHVPTLQSVSSVSYICRYKAIDANA